MNDIYSIQISFDGYLANGETTTIYHNVSVDDIINDDYLRLILDYHNTTQKATYNENLPIYNYRNNTNLQPVDVPSDYKRKEDKEYDNIEDVVNDAYLVKKVLFGKGRNVCIDIHKGEWGMDCCEDCGWSYQWELYKSIEE